MQRNTWYHKSNCVRNTLIRNSESKCPFAAINVMNINYDYEIIAKIQAYYKLFEYKYTIYLKKIKEFFI